MADQNGRSRARGPSLSRRQLLGGVAASGVSLLAGCGLLGENSRANPGEPPETNFRFEQNRGMKAGEKYIAIIEMIHDGGEKVDPDTLSVTIDGEPLAEREVWVWDKAAGTRNFDDIDGMMTKGEMVAIRSRHRGARGDIRHATGGEVIRLVWTSPEASETETPESGDRKVLGKFVVKECMGSETPNEDDECPTPTPSS